jgi:mono/diheme cytochrome c family protein
MKKFTTIFFFVASLFAVQACLGNAGDEEAEEPKIAAGDSHDESTPGHGAPGHHDGGESAAPGHHEKDSEHGTPGHHEKDSEHGAPGHHEKDGEHGAPGHHEKDGEHGVPGHHDGGEQGAPGHHGNGGGDGAPGHHGNGAQAAHWNAPEAEANRANPIAVSEASIAKGRKSYEMYCASCHGEDRTGNGPAGMALDPKPADLAMMAPMHPDGDLFWKIQTGKGAMISWKSVLSDESTWDVVNYLKNAESAEMSDAEGDHKQGEHTH